MPTDIDKLDGSLVAKNINKVHMSRNWESAECGALKTLLAQELARLKVYASKLKETVHHEAPYFGENKRKQRELEELLGLLCTQSSAFLELNRQNFVAYVQSV